jgi:hypothetical protein
MRLWKRREEGLNRSLPAMMPSPAQTCRRPGFDAKTSDGMADPGTLTFGGSIPGGWLREVASRGVPSGGVAPGGLTSQAAEVWAPS